MAWPMPSAGLAIPPPKAIGIFTLFSLASILNASSARWLAALSNISAALLEPFEAQLATIGVKPAIADLSFE
ncbi:MAG: hypothetical protein ACO3FZ_05375 [Candidatus Nanopelagicaceae bacterium]